MNVIDEVHICKKSMDLEIKVIALTEKLDRNKEIIKQKAIEIRKLNAQVRYYQKRASSLKDIISNMKSQELICDQAEEVLNVRS